MNKTSSAIVRSFLLGSSALCAFTIGVQANPTGGVVVSGSATITNSGSGATTTIDQKTGKVVIDWSTFSIGSGATVQFNQPGSSAIALNRVTGNQPSSIYGNLLANGQVWIINGNGILFGKGAQINVGGLIATTADLTNDDFLSGDYSFNGATGASVVNQGTIRAKKGGYAVLSGANVSNQGLIAADTGTVVIGGAKSYTVDFQGDGLLKYAITAPADKASASNSGTIKAQGGRVVMTARAAQSVQDAVVNNTGMISATSAKVGQDGEVILDGGDGDVAVSGTVDVSGTAPGTTGGTVAITGRNVTVADGTTIDASGAAGGGTVNIGGNLHGQGPLAHATNVTVGKATITADATDSGNGGQVVVWSDNDTSFAGSVSAKGGASGGDGGMVETSGHNLNVDPAVEIDTTAPKGKTGTWLIDPTNIFIVDGDQGTLDGNGNAPVGSGPTNDLLAPSTIVAALATTDVSLQASNQIEVVNNIDYTSSHTLSMLAQGSIIVLADIQNAGTGAINLVAGWDGTTTNTADFTNPGVYGNNGGTITLENDLSSAAISGHLATVGSAGGVVTLAAAGLSLDETDNRVQIGYDGNGGGDIDIVLTGDLTIDKQGTDDTFIGNGAFDSDVTGAATGNISINAGGTLTLTDANPGSGHLWIGNQGAPTFGETGNVTLIAGTIAEGTDLGPMIVADLGGGDVTLGVSNGDLAVDGASYDSSHNLTLLASGDLELPQTLSNDGTGSITLVAGWDGHSLGSALGQAGTYGNGNGFTTIGGENASGDVFVGSAGGSTTVYTGELDVFAENGSAQLGYDGAGSGDITVKATGNVELMGGDPSSSTMVAMIGNGSVADEIDAPVGGNISIDAGATFVIASVDGTLPSGNVGGGFGSGGGLPGGGDCGPDCILGLPPGGGGGAPLQQSGELPTVFIGNSAGRGTGAVSGSVTLTALDFDDTADSNGGFSAIIADDIVNGDVTIGQRDGEGFVELDHDFSYDSSHNLTVLSGDGLGVDAVIQNGGSGNITLIAGWDGITAPGAINAGTTSAYGFNGANGSVIYVGDGCVESCTYDAEIGTKSGTLSAFGGSLNVDASEGYAQLGYHGAGSGDIVVGTIGGITLQGGNSSDPEWDAQIGNGSVARDAGGNVSGNITITSGGTLDIEDGDGGIGWIGNAASGDFQETGNVTLVASSITGGDISFIAGDLGTSSDTGGDVFVGVTGADGWSIDQDIAYNSPHTLTLASVGNLQFDNTVQNDGTGNLNLVAGWDGTFTDMAQIVSSADYGANGATIFIGGSSQNENVSVGAASGTTTVLTGNLTIVPEGDLYGQLGYHGDGGGDITVTALGNITLEAGGSGSQYAQIGNGSIEEGQVSGPANGNIDVEAKGTLNLISDDQVGSDWIGNASDNSGSGAVTIVAADLGQTDRLAQMLRTDVQGGDTTLGITDANSGSTFSDGITYSSAFTLSILTAGNLTIAGAIQNSSSGQLNIVAGWDGTTFDATQFDAAGVYGNNSGIINIGGSGATGAVSVGSKGGTLVAGGDIHVNAAAFDAQIGYGDPAQGNIEVDATRDVTVETLVGSGGGLTARIGNGTAGASGIFGGTITIHAQDLSMIAGDSGDMVQVGNGGTNTTGSYAGDITVNLSGQLEMGAEGQNQIVQIGNGGSHGTGEAGGAIDIDAGSLLMRGDTGATGSFVQIGNGGSSFIGRAEDDINVTVSGALTIEELAGEPVWIGNLSSGSSGATYLGDATISAGSASGLASTVSDVLAGGDLEIEIFGDLDWNQDLTIDSDKTLNLLAAGNITFDASLKNSGGGTLNIVAGWDGATTDPALFGNGGVYGNNGGSVTIGGQNAGGDVSVGSATGIVNLFTDNLTVEADNGHAELGFDDEISGLSGGINVTAVDSVTLTGSDDDGVFAQIGNGVDLGDNGSGGGVGIVAGSMSQSGTAGIVGGTVSLATNDGGIGDGDNAISVTSTSLSISAAGDDAFVNSPNTGVSLSNVDMNGGSLTLVADGSVTQTGSISADALDIDTTGSSDGTVTLDDTGNSFASLSLDSGAGADIYDSQDLSINTAAVGEGATLTLASGGGITQSGEITADNLSVTSGTGDIVLDDTDNAINGLSVTTTGGHDATIFSNETIDLQTVSVEGTLTLNTTDGVTQEQSLSAGALNVTSGESGITLDNDGNDVTGDVSLNSGGDAVFHNDTDISAGASSVTGTLTLVSADGITQDGAIGAGTLSATANGGAITLDNTGNAFGTLNVSTTGDFDATVADTGDLDISGADVGGLLTLSTTGAISQDGALSAGSLSATAGAGGITLNTDGNSVAGDVSLNSGGDAIFNDGTDILVGASNVTGTLTLVSADGITQDGAISAGTLSLDANGAITLDDDGNSFGALDVSAPGSGTVSITDSTGVVLDDIQTGGDFTLNAAGDVTQNDALGITGTLSVTTTNGGAVTLDNVENVVSGDVAFDGAADVTFDSAGAVDLDASSAVGTLTISANGPIIQSGVISTDALDVTTTGSGNGITLDDTDNSFNTLTVNSSAGAVITDSLDLSVSSAIVAEGATLTLTSAGGISQTGDIDADNLDATSGTGDIVLDDSNNAIGGLSVTTTGGHDATISSDESIDLQTVSVSGALTLNTTGGVTQEQGLSAGGLNVTAGESGITLDNDGNDVTGDVSLNAGGDAVFHNDTDISMGASNVTGTLTLVSAGGITQDGAIGANALVATANGGAIVLDDPSNAFASLTVSTAGNSDATFVDTGALDIAASTVGGTLTVTTDGEITQSGAITAAGLTATSQDSDLGFGFNNFISGDVSLTAATDATFFNEGQLTVGTSNVGGLLSLTSSSAGITQDGAISADTLSLTAPGGVTLDNGGNSFNALDLFVSGTNANVVSDASSLELDDVSVGGDLVLSSGGDIAQTQPISVGGALTANADNGTITLDETGNDIGGTVSLNASGDATFDNGTDTDLGTSIVGGTLTVASDGAITQSGALTAGTLDVSTTSGSITLANTNNDFDTLQVATGGTDDATIVDGTDVTVSGATVGGTLSLTASSIGQSGAIGATGLNLASTFGVTLDDGGNSFQTLSVSGGNASVTDSTGVSLGAIDLGGRTFTLSAGGTITQTGTITAREADISTTSGAIVLTNPDNVADIVSFTTAGGDATIVDNDVLTVGADLGGDTSETGGTLTVTAQTIFEGDSITAAAVNATATLSSIGLDNSDNDVGSFNVTTTGTDNGASLTNSGTLNISGANVSGSLDLTSINGGITQSGAITSGDLLAGAATASPNPGDNDIVLTNPDNDVSGRFEVSTPNNASFTNSQSIAMDESEVDGTLTLVSGGAITQLGGGDLTVGTLTATAGEGSGITLNEADNAIGTLNLTTFGGDASITDSTGVVLGTIDVDGHFALFAGGDVTQTQALSISNGFDISTSSGDITLDNPGNDVTGTVSFGGADNVTYVNDQGVDLGASIVGGTLSITAGGDISQEAGLQADELDVSTSNGSITLDSAKNTFNTLNVSTAGEGAGDATLVDASDLTVASADVEGTLTLTAASIGQSGSINAGALNVTSTEGGITLQDPANAFGALSVTTGGSDAAVNDSQGFDLTGADVGSGTVTLSADGAITQSGAITAGEVDVSTTTGSITLDDADNAFGALNVSTQGDDGATIVDTGDLTVTGATIGGTLFLTAGSIGQTGEIDANALGVTGANGITLDNANNKFSGLEVSTTDADALITDAWGIDIYAANTGAGVLTINSGGMVTQEADADITAGGLNVSADPRGIVLNNQGNAVSGDVTFDTDGDVTFHNDQQVTFGQTTVGGTLTVFSGAGIDQDGAISAGTLTATAGEGTITLTDSGNAFGTLNLTTTSSSDVAIVDSTGVDLGAIDSAGRLILSAGGDVTQSQALNLSNGFDISTSNGDITLDNPGNDVTGTVSFDGTNNVTYVNGQGVDLGASIVGGTLSITAGGDITQEAGLSADELDVSANDGAITLDSAKNTFNTLNVSTVGEGAGAATLVDASDLTVASADVEGTLTLTAASAGQSGSINAGALNVTATEGGITLQDGGNAFGALSVTTGGSDAAVNDSQGFDLTGADVGSGTVTLSADGAITQSGAITAGEVDVSTTTGSITLDDADNAFGALNVSTQGDDGATIVDTGDLTVTGATVGGTLILTAGSIGQAGAIDADVLGVTGTNGITLDNANNTFSGVQIDTTDADALITDARGIDIFSANTGAGVLTINSGGNVGQEHAITAGGLTISSGEGDITLDNAANAVSGDVSFTTGTNVVFFNSLHTTLSDTDVGGEMLVNAAGLDQDGAVTIGTLTANVGEGTITLTNAGNVIGALDLTSTSTSDVAIVDSTGVDLGAIEVGGRFILSAGGDVTQSLALVLGNGMAISSSGGDVTLNDAGNQVSGDVSFSTDGETAFSNIGQITLGQTTVGGTLTLTGAGIDQDGAVNAGTLTADATKGTVTLTDGGNVFGTVNLSTTSEEDVSVTDSTGITLGAIAVGGKLVIAAGGDVTQNKALGLSNGMSITATGGDITLDNADNTVSGDISFNGTGDATFVNGVATTLDTSSVDGTLSVTAGGDITQDGAIAAGELDVSSTNGSIALTNADNDFAALNVSATVEGGDATIVDGTDLTVTGANVGGTLSLTANSIGQTGAITADTLSVSDGTGIVLTNEDNAFDNLQVATDGADASFADSRDMNVISANLNGGTLTLDSAGLVTQSGAIDAGGLTVSAGEGGITLTDTHNAVSGDIVFDTAGDASFNDTQQITFGETSVGGTLTATSGAGIDQDGAISAGTLTASAGEGTIMLDDAGNVLGTVNLSSTSSQSTFVTDSTGLTLGQIVVGGPLIVAAGGDVDQNQALVLGQGGMDVTSSDGGIDLSNTGNAVSGTVRLHSAGDATFANTLTTQLGASRTGGTLTLLSKGDVDVVDVVQNASGNIVVVAGWDGETTDPESFGNAGVYGNANGSLVIGGGGTTNFAALGSQSGTTTVYAYNVSLLGTNASAQLGYHGTGGGDIDMLALNDLTVTAGSGNAYVGNGSMSTDIEGNVTGNIDLRVGGNAAFTNATDKVAWFGNHIVSGTETGNVVLVADSIDAENGADIGTIVVTDVVGGDVTIGGTSTEDGGIDVGKNYSYDSTHTLSLLTAGNLLVEGSIQNSGTGAINLVAGWDGQTLNDFGLESAGLGGKGVTIGGADATGGVAVGSAGGTTSVYGASLTLSALNGYAQLGVHGAGTGAVVVTVSGDVALNGGAATGDFAQIGNGGLGTSGDNGGDILIGAGGDVTLTGGAGTEAYAQIGLGGAESNSNSAGYSNTGDIAIAATNVVVDAGTGSGAYAQIGNGGLKSGQGLTGEGDNTGDIVVAASHSVSLLGSGDDGYAQIGNGGSQSNLGPSATASGADTGTVTVIAPNGADGSVTLGAGAGANAYAQIGNGGYDVNAGTSAVAGKFAIGGDITVTDLVLTGNGDNAYAVIGNGDVTKNSYGNVSGNIFIDANGNITYTNGAGTNSFATIGNFTGHGTVSGTINGATPPDIDGDGGDKGAGDINNNPATVGTVVSTQQQGNQPLPITVVNTIVVTIEQGDDSTNGLSAALVDDNPPGPLASLDTGYADSEPPTTADSATVVIADSLDGDKQGSTTQSMLGGLLKQNNAPTGSHAVHAIPPADQDFSSWGNEALWQ